MGYEHDTTASQLRHGQYGVRELWALGVGIVVCGQYFGWNQGLRDNGPTAFLIASLVVGLLFLAWVLTFAELVVALPRASGPLEYGQQAGSRALGFLMGWSILLACFFGGVATSLAGGKYVAFLLAPETAPNPYIVVAVGLAIVVVFLILHVRGIREQARLLVWMTYLALAALVLFWIVALTNFDSSLLRTEPLLPTAKGWGSVLDAIPFALWWLIIIEAAGLAAEEARTPARIIPRGLLWAVLTVLVMLVLTTLTACGAVPFQAIAMQDGTPVDYPLAAIFRLIPVGQNPILFYGFGAIAFFGLIASYHGLLYGASRQLFALGRGGYVAPCLGRLSVQGQAPVPALLCCSVLMAVCVVANVWFDEVIQAAVLVAGLAALVLYILSMVALLRLRRRTPNLFAQYRAPLRHWLPLVVLVLSSIALAVYPRIDAQGVVLPVSLGMYAIGFGYYLLQQRFGPKQQVAPPAASPTPSHTPSRTTWLQRVAVAVLGLALLMIAGLAVDSFTGFELSPTSDAVALAVLGVVCLALLLIVAVEWLQPHRES